MWARGEGALSKEKASKGLDQIVQGLLNVGGGGEHSRVVLRA